MMSWMLAIPLLGFATGLRSMTPIAVLCWFGYFGTLPVHHDWAFWTTRLVTAIVFTVFAVGEYIGDVLPQMPNRTSPVPLTARLILGGLVGALAATALHGSALEGIILGSLGALLGAFVGFHVRRDLVQSTGWPDWTAAITEDAVAILAAVFAMAIVTG
ncbi:DUF4126 family protein [Granulicella arctica]|uniref:Putative membrane protein n=1 Tax=Granulicella arctica TaxID=940613 RepID=A0A7Y9PF56_9BACT|nr:DUF4126 family protein [Granulicella arctica]NYF78540.1 putative membrane protein [Granulicella arctica]